MTTSTTSTTAPVPAVAGYHDGRVEIGHDAATGLPVDFLARTERRLCNGIIIGATGTTTLAEYIAEVLRAAGGWLVCHVRAAWPPAPRRRYEPLRLLAEAEQRAARPGRHRDLHLVIWDGFAHLAADPALRERDFVGRVSELAHHGPEYGVAQLVIVDPAHLHAGIGVGVGGDVDPTGRLREVLSDNVIALPTDNSDNSAGYLLGGYLIDPTRLPRERGERGQALVLRADDRTGRELVHTHLDLGRSRSDCEPCQLAATSSLREGAIR